LAEEICINSQISEVFKKTEPTHYNSKEQNEVSFYGKPSKILYTKDFIDLPYLEEFIFELIKEVKVKGINGKMRLHDEHLHSLGIYPFLILVDNMFVFDHEAVLKMRTNIVERVEVVPKGYVIGNQKYSGLINVFTKKKNLSGIKLPENSMFFNYQMFTNQQNIDAYSPSKQVIDNLRIPDRRNCLYWNPDFQVNENSENEFSFYTSDIKGIYQIILEAVTTEGSKLIIATTEFSVE